MMAPGMSRVRLVFHEDESDDEDKQRARPKALVFNDWLIHMDGNYGSFPQFA